MVEKRNIIKTVLLGQDLTSDELKNVDAGLDKLGQRMQKVGAAMTAGGLAIAGGLAQATKAAGDLEEGVLDALTLVDAQGEAFTEMAEGMTRLALDLSRDLNFSGREITTGFYDVLSTGAQALTPQFEQLTRTALALSKVTGLELGISVERVADTVKAFNLDLSEANRIADVFFNTSKLVSTNIPQLSEAFREAGAASATLGIDIETTSAILAAFAEKGTKSTDAGTLFRVMMLRLTTASGEAKDELDKLVTVFDTTTGKLRDPITILQELQESMEGMTDAVKASTLELVFGERAFARLGAILGSDLSKLENWRDKIGETDTLQTALNVKLSAFNERMTAVKLSAQRMAIALGTQLLPSVTAVGETITELIDRLTEWIDANPRLAEGLGILSIALIGAGGLATALGTTIRLMNVLKTTSLVAFGPAGLITLAVLGTAGVIIALATHLKGVKAELDEIQEIGGGGKLSARQAAELENLTNQLETGIKGFQTIISDSKFVDPIKVPIALSEEDRQQVIARIQELQELAGFEFVGPLLPEEFVGPLQPLSNEMLALKENVEDLLVQTPRVGDALDRVFGTKLAEAMRLVAGDSKEAADNLARLAEEEEKRRQKKADDVASQEIEDPLGGLLDPKAEKKAKDRAERIGDAGGDAVQGAMLKAFQNIEDGANVLEGTLNAAFTSIASHAVAEIGRIIAKWLALKALQVVGGFLGLPVPVPGAQGGGTVRIGNRGVDNVILAVGQDETILTDDTTDRITAFLDRAERGQSQNFGAGSSAVNVNVFAAATTISSQDAVRFGRITKRELDAHNSTFIAKGFL